MGAIFLSASVPLSGRAPFDQDSEPQMIQSAVSALATVALGRKAIVWGGHPSITPMLWASAQDLGVQYATAVQLFQSRFFSTEDFPDENRHFANVRYVDAVEKDLARSLNKMRDEMLRSTQFDAAVFIGGMQGIYDEHAMFSELHPGAKCLPIAITGGATRTLATKLQYAIPADLGPLDFVSLLYRELAISPIEPRQR
jgi:hypothetical protein